MACHAFDNAFFLIEANKPQPSTANSHARIHHSSAITVNNFAAIRSNRSWSASLRRRIVANAVRIVFDASSDPGTAADREPEPPAGSPRAAGSAPGPCPRTEARALRPGPVYSHRCASQVKKEPRQHLDADEQDDEPEVERDLAQTQGRDHLPQHLQRRIGERVHDLGEHEEETGRLPLA